MKTFQFTYLLPAIFAAVVADYKFTSVDCESSGNKTLIFEKCEVDAKFINFTAVLHRKLESKLFIEVAFNKLDKGAYRQIFKVSKIEWCSLMAGSSRSNYMFSALIDMIKSAATDNIFHKCPYEGKVVIVNGSMKKQKILSIYPDGGYRFVIKASDELDDNVFLVKTAFDLKE